MAAELTKGKLYDKHWLAQFNFIEDTNFANPPLNSKQKKKKSNLKQLTQNKRKFIHNILKL